jgi:hypothetical protein
MVLAAKENLPINPKIHPLKEFAVLLSSQLWGMPQVKSPESAHSDHRQH